MSFNTNPETARMPKTLSRMEETLLRSPREKKNHQAIFVKASKSNTHNKVGPIRTKQLLERLHCGLVGAIKPSTPGK